MLEWPANHYHHMILFAIEIDYQLEIYQNHLKMLVKLRLEIERIFK